MTQHALGKVWAFFAVALLTLSVLFFLRTTGATPKGDLFGLLAYGPNTIAVLALPFDLILFAITLGLTWIWSSRSNGKSWAERMPIFYFDPPDVDPRMRAGKVYQGFAFFLTLVLPALLIGQMYDRFLKATIYDAGAKCLCVLPAEPTKEVKQCRKDEILRFGETKNPSGTSDDGPQYFCWEPALFGIVTAIVALIWAGTLYSVCAGGRPRPPGTAGPTGVN